MTKNKKIIAAMAVVFSSSVWADEPISLKSDSDIAMQLEPILVNAEPAEKDYAIPYASSGTKTDTPIMETPLNIQVIPQQVLQDQKANTLEQALRNVSGVKTNPYGGLQESIFLRGFLTTTTFRNGFRIDDTNGNGLRNMTNVESVEVLKGPAAILYGRVEPGGMVNLVTKQPLETPYYSAEQQAGSWGHYLTNLDATGPANEDRSLLYRINASYDTSNSWRDNVTNERFFIAPTLQWRLSPKTQMTLEAEYNHNPHTYDATQYLPYDTITNQFVQLPRNKNLAAGDPIATNSTYFGFNWSHQFNNDWSIKHQIMYNEAKTKTDPFYYAFNFTQVSPTSWTVDRARTFGVANDKIVATVLDLTGHFDTAGLKHTLLLGADFYQQKMKSTYGYDSGLPSTTDAFNPTPPTGLEIDPTTLTTANSTTDNYGVYVQDQIKLPGNIHVLGGLRYQKVKQTNLSTDAAGVATPSDQSDHDVTPRVGILWQAQNWLSLYGNYAENFGANTGRSWDGAPMKPEGAQQKEIGTKVEFFDGKLRAGLDYFDLTKQNVATADKINDPTGAFGYQLSIGEVQSKGTELDIQGEIQPGWNVIATYAHTNIRITKSNNGDVGLRKEDVPKDMASLWTTFEFKQESLRGLKIGGGVNGYGSTTDSTNTIDTPGYALLNAMAAYDFKAGEHKVTAQLNINNLLDKTYYTNAWVSGNVGILYFGTPRNAMASLRFEF